MSGTDDLDHDVIIVGAGVAGSRLVAHLLASPWRTRRIVVIEAARRPDHALAFWASEATPLDPLVQRSWTALRVPADDGDEVVRPLAQHRYAMLTRGALEQATRAAGEACPTLRFIEGTVDAIEDGPEAAVVRVGGRRYRGTWVFDSRPAPPGPATIRLVQRFVGWTVEAPALRQDPKVATLFDFHTAQGAGSCFIYVLPLGTGRALVEQVFTGPDEAVAPDAESALRSYISDRLGVEGEPVIVARERGSSSLSDARHPRRLGRRVCAIGIRGGRLKPSSGYALMRIERDSAAIVRSLTRHGHPFDLPRERRLYRWLDAIFLSVLARAPARAPAIFAALMRRPDRTLRLLDERAGAADLLLLLAALPTWLFLAAALRWLFARRRPILAPVTMP